MTILRPALLSVSLFGMASMLYSQQGVDPSLLDGAQGNAAQTRLQSQAEMDEAVRKARDERALKEAMAAQAMSQQPVYTTAEQYMAANAPQEKRQDLPTVTARRHEELPQFKVTSSAMTAPPADVAPAPAAPTQAGETAPQSGGSFLPVKKRGLLGFLKKSDDALGGNSLMPSVQSAPMAGYEPAAERGATAPAEDFTRPNDAARDAAMMKAVEGTGARGEGSDSESCLGKLFRRKGEKAAEETQVVPAVEAAMTYPAPEAGAVLDPSRVPVPASIGSGGSERVMTSVPVPPLTEN